MKISTSNPNVIYKAKSLQTANINSSQACSQASAKGRVDTVSFSNILQQTTQSVDLSSLRSSMVSDIKQDTCLARLNQLSATTSSTVEADSLARAILFD